MQWGTLKLHHDMKRPTVVTKVLNTYDCSVFHVVLLAENPGLSKSLEHVFCMLTAAFTYMDRPLHTGMGFQNLHSDSDSDSIAQISVVLPMTLLTETQAIFMRNHWMRSCCVIACFLRFICLGLPLLCSCFCCREWINASRCYYWYFFGPMQMSYCASVLENGWTGVCLGCDRRIYCCTTIIWEAMSGHSLSRKAHKQSTDLISILLLTEPQLCTKRMLQN